MDKDVQIIPMRDGRYLVCPKDFLVVNKPCAPEESTFAGVVEARDHAKFKAPDIVFFSDRAPGCEMTEEEREAIFAACRKVWPKFDSVAAKSTWGCFSIPEEGGPEFENPFFTPAYGAIVRKG